MTNISSISTGFDFRIKSGKLLLANEAAQQSVTLFLPNQLIPPAEGTDHWVQLSPFGDFGNVAGKKRVIQRFRKEDGVAICNSFNGPLRKVLQPLGMPFYIGHPDHPRFANQQGHADTRAYGRGKEMAVRHDPNCAACAAFTNAENADAAPCQEHGLFVKMHWNDDGQRLIANESFHGHSVNWNAIPDGMEGGVQIYRPTSVKSVGFTNQPNIPVKPASLANAESSEGEDPTPAVPAKLKLLAGFKADDDCTMEQIIAALEKARPAEVANEAATEAVGFFTWLKTELAQGYDKLPDQLRYAVNTLVDYQRNQGTLKAIVGEALANITPSDTHKESLQSLEAQLANSKTEAVAERKARAQLVVDGLVKTGKVVTKDREAAIEQLANSGDGFEAKAADLGNARVIIKTTAKSTGLAMQHAQAVEGERGRASKFQELIDKREKEFPNESYEERFRAVLNSGEGAQLFAQMKKNGTEEN